MARSFYDDAENRRIVEIHENPTGASLLRSVVADAVRASMAPVAAPSPPAVESRGANRSAVLSDSEAMHKVRMAQEEKLTMALKYVFELYNRWEGGVNRSRMCKMRFHKVLRCASVLLRYSRVRVTAAEGLSFTR